MNKKLLLGAALLVGLGTTLTSCVDTTESASVTNVRNAKAEQLKSIAYLNQKQADAALIIAEAQKASQAAEQAYKEAQAELLAAQAAYQRAQADYLAAETAALNAKTEADKQRLEKELALMQAELDAKAQELAEAKDNQAAQKALLEATLAQLEQALEKSKIEVANAQFLYDQMVKHAQEMEDYKAKQEALAQAALVKQLINNYNTAAVNLNNAQRKLAQDQANLARLEAGLQNAKETCQTAIKNLKGYKAMYESEIEYWESVKDLYAEYAGKQVTWDDYDLANVEYIKAQEAFKAAFSAYDTANSAFWKADNNLRTSNYQGNVQQTIWKRGLFTVKNDKMERKDYYNYSIELIPTYKTYVDWQNAAPANCRGKWTLVISTPNYREIPGYDQNSGAYGARTYEYYPVYEDIEWEEANVEVDGKEISYDTYTSYFNLVDNGKGLEKWLECVQAEFKNQIEDLTIDELKAKLATAKAELQKAEATYDADLKAYNEVNAAYEKAKADATAQRQIYEDLYAQAYRANEEVKKLRELGANAEEITKAEEKRDGLYDDADEAWEKYVEKNAEVNDKQPLAEFKKWIKDQSKWKVEDWTVTVINLENQIAIAENDSAAITSDNIYAEMVASIEEQAAGNIENITAYNEASKEYKIKDVAYSDADNALTIAKNNVKLIVDAIVYNEGILGGNADANNEIEEAQSNIDFYQGWIDYCDEQIINYTNTLNNLNSDDPELNGQYYNDLKADLERDIANDQADVDKCQQLFNIAKAELEAAVKAE